MKTRRDVLISAALFSLGTAADCAPEKTRKIGWLTAQQPASLAPYLEALRQGLVEQKLVEGQNIAVLSRFGNDDVTKVSQLARDLVASSVELIIVQGAAVGEVAKMTLPVPVIFIMSGDPIAAGLARSLSEPLGNRTGVTFMAFELLGKRLELLKELIPDIRQVTVLGNPGHAGAEIENSVSVEAGLRLGLSMRIEKTATSDGLDRAFRSIAEARPDAISLLPDGFAIAHRAKIMDFATSERIPVISGWPVFAHAGAVCTYGPQLQQMYRRIGYFVARILAGTKPSELPIERPAQFELILNRRAANKLNIALGRTVLARADEVLE